MAAPKRRELMGEVGGEGGGEDVGVGKGMLIFWIVGFFS